MGSKTSKNEIQNTNFRSMNVSFPVFLSPTIPFEREYTIDIITTKLLHTYNETLLSKQILEDFEIYDLGIGFIRWWYKMCIYHRSTALSFFRIRFLILTKLKLIAIPNGFYNGSMILVKNAKKHLACQYFSLIVSIPRQLKIWVFETHRKKKMNF